MFSFLNRFFDRLAVSSKAASFLSSHEKPPLRRFSQSDTSGATTAVTVPDFEKDTKIAIAFRQSRSSRAKRRRGRPRSVIKISLENAENLHTVLGEALKDAKVKVVRRYYIRNILNFVLSHSPAVLHEK